MVLFSISTAETRNNTKIKKILLIAVGFSPREYFLFTRLIGDA